jgi:hypothetical protein
MCVGRGGSERLKCACARARTYIFSFLKKRDGHEQLAPCTCARLGSLKFPHLCSRPAANSSSICSVKLSVRSSRRSRSSSKHTTQISLHTDKTCFQGPSFAAAGTLSLTHNNTHASAYRLCYSCPATHVKPSRTRTSRDARRVSSESSPVCERRTLLAYISRRQEREYRAPSTWCARTRARALAPQARTSPAGTWRRSV